VIFRTAVLTRFQYDHRSWPLCDNWLLVYWTDINDRPMIYWEMHAVYWLACIHKFCGHKVITQTPISLKPLAHHVIACERTTPLLSLSFLVIQLVLGNYFR